jgi:putative lipoprotein (rSAM/lipoprotein system)
MKVTKFGFKIYARFISLLILLIGFTASVCAQYGAPIHRFVFNGKIKTEDSTKAVPPVRVNVSYDYYKNSNSQETFSSEDGSFSFNLPWYVTRQSLKVTVSDISKQKHGEEYETKEMIIFLPEEEKKMKFSSSDWDEYAEVYSANIFLRKKESEYVNVKNNLAKKRKINNNDSLVTNTMGFLNNSSFTSSAIATYLDTPRINIYPNPSSGQIKIMFLLVPDNHKAFLNIYDIRGRVVMSKWITEINENYPIQVDLAELQPAPYLIRLSTEQSNYSQVIVKY